MDIHNINLVETWHNQVQIQCVDWLTKIISGSTPHNLIFFTLRGFYRQNGLSDIGCL
jgi:hypothetical protein